MKSINVFAPATVANVACGFDILGFAVDAPGDEVCVTLSDQPGVRITKITGDEGRLPKEIEKNTAGLAALKYLKAIESKQGITIEIHKKMPLGSGLGSSAASSVATLFALNELMGGKMSKKEMLPFAMEGERLACGAAHADNVAPALFGGFVLIRSYDPLDVIEIDTPDNLYCTVVHPDVEVKTEDARRVLKQQLTLKNAIQQWGNTAGLIAGLLKKDYSLIGRSLEDVVVEPARAILIPHFHEVKSAALKSGALGSSISGAGPSVFALCEGKEIAEKAGKAMQQAFRDADIESQIYVSKVNGEGPKIISNH